MAVSSESMRFSRDKLRYAIVAEMKLIYKKDLPADNPLQYAYLHQT